MTTNRQDDLTGLLRQSEVPSFTLLQGVVTAWNATTRANTVALAGGVELHNLPIIGASEVSEIGTDSIVAVLRWKSSYFILGVIIKP